MKNKNSSLLFSIFVGPIIFVTIFFSLSLLIKPVIISSVTQIINNKHETDSTFFEVIKIGSKVKTKINKKVILIYFIDKKSEQKILVQDWYLENYLILKKIDNKIENWNGQKVAITIGYESILEFVFKNIF